MTERDTQPETSSALTWRVALVEAGFIFVLIFLYAGWPAPDVNEAHYLAKAKHYWDPSWCAGDFFLESADAHLVFYWTTGWLTLMMPLPAVAWTGRVVTWLLLAWSWQRLSWSVAPRRFMAVLTAAIFILLLHYCHMAGEWIFGGVEAKGFAFVCIFLALENIQKGRWWPVWLLLGAASAFHVLAGGWCVIAAGFAFLLTAERKLPSWKMLASLAGGGALALAGVLPALALTWGVDPEVVREANRIYVFERLPHHLVLHSLPVFEAFGYVFVSHFILRHVALIAVWCIAWRITRGELARMHGVVAGAVLIALVGAVIDFSTWTNQEAAAGLLRYYWFRLSDVMVPLGVTFAVPVLLKQLENWRRTAGAWALCGAIVLSAAVLLNWYAHRSQYERCGADLQTLPQGRNEEQRREILDHWQNACGWIAENTEPSDGFLTPRHQQTFRWLTGRREAFNWKDIPQDAPGIVAWRKRSKELFPTYALRFGITAHRDRKLMELARKYNAQYLIVDRTRCYRTPKFPRVYPPRGSRGVAYEVYRIPVENAE